MRKGNFATLLGITAVVAAAALALKHRGAEASETAAAGPLFPDLSAHINDVTGLTVTSSTGSVTIRHDGDTWRVDERDGYPARFELVKAILLGVADLDPQQAKTTRPELYGKLGLTDPEQEGSDAALLTLTGAQGSALAAVLVGHAGLQANTLYVRKSGDSQCWLARGAIVPERQPTGWMDRDLIKLPSGRVHEVTITHPDGEQVLVSRAKLEDSDWKIQNVPEGSEPKSPGLGRTLAVSLESLSFDDVASAAGHPLTTDGRVTTVLNSRAGKDIVTPHGVFSGRTE